MTKHSSFHPILFLAFISLNLNGGEVDQNIKNIAKTDILPVVNRLERSDWINVKTDITPAAVGNGIVDDTDALQSALTKYPLKPIYLPPGIYRITNTLRLAYKERTGGVTILGHGRSTKIIWDGPNEHPMLETHGLHRSRISGLLLDGQNRASAGMMHLPDKGFETGNRFQYVGFINFTKYGLAVPIVKGNLAAAEVFYQNCLFSYCKEAGVHLAGFNVYNHIFTGCEFSHCGTGLYYEFAQGSVWNSHFESNDTDIYAMGAQGFSFRRLTSYGSKRFIVQNRVGTMTVQNCKVEGWGEYGAIQIQEEEWQAPL